MSKVERILRANGIATTTEGVNGGLVIIAWDDLGINEEARFKLDVDLKKVYEFLGY
jgi:hypothetical protein